MVLSKNFSDVKKEKSFIVTMALISLIFLAVRVAFIDQGFFEGAHYEITLSPKSIANNLTWYILWFLSLPEYVINFVGSGLRPLPPLLGVYRSQTLLSLAIVGIQGSILMSIFFASKHKKSLSFGALYFLIALVPVLIFPWHKYVYYLPLASVFLMINLSRSLQNMSGKTKLGNVFFLVLVVTSIGTNLIDRSMSSSYQRGVMAKAIKEHTDFEKIKSGDKTILIANDLTFSVFSEEWGSTSTQAKVVLHDALFFILQTKNDQLKVIYEDDQKEKPSGIFDYTLVISKEW